MFDLKNNIKLVECLNAIVKAADTDCTAVDTQGANSAMVMVNVGAPGITFSGTNKVDIKLEDSADNSSFTAVTPPTLSEVEIGALYIDTPEAVPARRTLEEIGHPLPRTPMQTDNITALGVVSSNIHPQKTR